jgi:hypothetical protein
MPPLRISQVHDFRIGQQVDLFLGQVTKYYYFPSTGSGRGGSQRAAMRDADSVYYLHADDPSASSPTLRFAALLGSPGEEAYNSSKTQGSVNWVAVWRDERS